MRIVLMLASFGLLAQGSLAEESVNEEVVKLVRAALDAKRAEQREEYLKQALGHDGLDWPSLAKGLRTGPYYQKPMVTAYGERHSGEHFDIRYDTGDGKPRGFSLWVPKSYDAKTPIPAIVYLHHAPSHPRIQMGSERAGVALLKFRDACEKHGVLFIAPYTSKGAEWWTDNGKKLVHWTLREVRKRYNLDDDRIGLLGALGGGDAVWCLGQEMPGTWSVLMPMTGDPYEIGAMIRPLYLGTLDRMDVLVGVSGKTNSTVGVKNQSEYLALLEPMFDQRMRITTAVYPTSQGDFGYLEKIKPQIMAFVLDHERKPYADEVDVETDEPGLASLWLRNDGYDADGVVPWHRTDFKSTLLPWKAPERKEPQRKIGVHLQARPHWPAGVLVTNAEGAASKARIFPRDVLLEVDGVPVKTLQEVKELITKHDWNTEVRLLLAREVKESDRKRAERAERAYQRIRRKIEELRAAGKPIPDDIGAQLEDEEDAIEGEDDSMEDEDDGGGIMISDDSEVVEERKAKGETEKTFFMIVERWVMLRKPVGPIARADFGAQWDPNYEEKGVRLRSVYAGSLAHRSGLRDGDVIVQVGDTEVKTAYDIERWFDSFEFEEEPEGERWVAFTIKRQEGQGNWVDRTVRVTWNEPVSSRVDARWNKKENALYVLARKASGFTLFFNEKLIEPGKKFHLFINGVPYRDLVDPATAPDYPHVTLGSDAAVADRLYRMQRERALVDGWTPDYEWAVKQYLEHRDRGRVYGAQRSFGMTAMKAGFEKARSRHGGRRGGRGERVKKAYDQYKSKG